MKTTGHEHEIAVAHRHRLVKRAIRRVHPLHRKPADVPEAVVVGLLELRFLRRIVGVVLVRWIARPVPGGRHHLGHEERLRGGVLHENVMDRPLHVPHAAHLAPHV